MQIVPLGCTKQFFANNNVHMLNFPNTNCNCAILCYIFICFLQVFYNFFTIQNKAQLIISNVHLFSPFSICTSTGSLFLASLCLSISALLQKKECLRVVVFAPLSQCTTPLSVFLLFVLLYCKYSLSSTFCLLAFSRSALLEL